MPENKRSFRPFDRMMTTIRNYRHNRAEAMAKAAEQKHQDAVITGIREVGGPGFSYTWMDGPFEKPTIVSLNPNAHNQLAIEYLFGKGVQKYAEIDTVYGPEIQIRLSDVDLPALQKTAAHQPQRKADFREAIEIFRKIPAVKNLLMIDYGYTLLSDAHLDTKKPKSYAKGVEILQDMQKDGAVQMKTETVADGRFMRVYVLDADPVKLNRFIDDNPSLTLLSDQPRPGPGTPGGGGPRI